MKNAVVSFPTIGDCKKNLFESSNLFISINVLNPSNLVFFGCANCQVSTANRQTESLFHQIKLRLPGWVLSMDVPENASGVSLWRPWCRTESELDWNGFIVCGKICEKMNLMQILHGFEVNSSNFDEKKTPVKWTWKSIFYTNYIKIIWDFCRTETIDVPQPKCQERQKACGTSMVLRKATCFLTDLAPGLGIEDEAIWPIGWLQNQLKQ